MGTEPSGFELELAVPCPVVRSSKARYVMWVGTKGITVVGDQRRSKNTVWHGDVAPFLCYSS